MLWETRATRKRFISGITMKKIHAPSGRGRRPVTLAAQA